MTERVQGPQSYFPSIETKYGNPVEYWFSTLESLPEMTHMEMVSVLKEQHGMGHGHANALVAYFRKR